MAWTSSEPRDWKSLLSLETAVTFMLGLVRTMVWTVNVPSVLA